MGNPQKGRVSKKAIFYGFLADYGGSLFVGTIFGVVLMIFGFSDEDLNSNIVALSIGGFLGLILDVVGGFTAGYIARKNFIMHSLAVGGFYLCIHLLLYVLSVLFEIPLGIKKITEMDFMFWLSFVFSVPFIIAGGFLAKKFIQDKEGEFALSEIPGTKTLVFLGKKLKSSDAVLVVLILIIISFFTLAQIGRKNAFENFIFGLKDSNNKDSQIIKDILKDYFRKESEAFPAMATADNANLFQVESYKTKESLHASISLLESAKKELEQFEKINEALLEDVREDIKNAFVEDEEVLRGFEHSINDERRISLIRNRVNALLFLYTDALDLYRFQLDNFDNYVIELDYLGEEKIFFKEDFVADEFFDYADRIQNDSIEFMRAEKELANYVSAQMGISGKDLRQTIQYLR